MGGYHSSSLCSASSVSPRASTSPPRLLRQLTGGPALMPSCTSMSRVTCHVDRVTSSSRTAALWSRAATECGGGGRGGGRLACLESPLLPSFLPSAAVRSIISFQVAPGSCHCCIENCSKFTKFLWIPPSCSLLRLTHVWLLDTVRCTIVHSQDGGENIYNLNIKQHD